MRADKFFMLTTIFFAVLFIVMFVAMNDFNNDLIEQNQELLNTIESMQEVMYE